MVAERLVLDAATELLTTVHTSQFPFLDKVDDVPVVVPVQVSMVPTLSQRQKNDHSDRTEGSGDFSDSAPLQSGRRPCCDSATGPTDSEGANDGRDST